MPDERRAAWLWRSRTSAPEIAAFLERRRVTDVWLSVPWQGPDAVVVAHARTLSARGIRVAALGGEPSWATDAAAAVAWARRAAASGLFTGVHLDIEPWASPEWAADAERLVAGLARTVRAVAAQTVGPVEVDLPGWLARDHPRGFAAIAGAVSTVCVMAYRSHAASIAREAAAAARLLHGTGFLLGVDTLPSADPDTTFAGRTRTELERETAAASATVGPTGGIAVHDVDGWMRLRP